MSEPTPPTQNNGENSETCVTITDDERNQLDGLLDSLDAALENVNKELCDEKCEDEKKLEQCRNIQYKTTQEFIECENFIKNYNLKYEIPNNGEETTNPYQDELDKITYNLKNEHETMKNNISLLITDYEMNTIYYNKFIVLYNKIIKEKSLYDEEIDNYNKIVNTSDRKTFYEDENINTVNNRKKLLLFIYWLIFSFLVYKLLYVNGQYKNPLTIVELVILAILPIYGLHYIKNAIMYIIYNIRMFYYKYISFK